MTVSYASSLRLRVRSQSDEAQIVSANVNFILHLSEG